ncbi:NAD(P)/FAD-dependent oxidoreductase [Nocardia sp. NEAU-G5]|uniref:Ferredoxin--NADP reductase n=1 Tax=Nocardia albiluteola TaxID=2842303 RepID=A0ABS6BBX2_9NOCA|nr:NAD(P)/FAD-dependent oxidoreductase [Nocardia albiluteola]MBU3067787.1 NAD(P)/FAD-dependent oxidoreductase [Nocardia albiluteola]
MLDTDLLIIGGGPVGLYACYYAGMRGLSVTVVDSLPHLGGQTAALYPEKDIYDIAGFPAVTGRELVARLTEQAMTADPTVVLRAEALRLADMPDNGFLVTTTNENSIRARAILLTAGIGRFTPRPLPALDGYTGAGIEHVLDAPHTYADRDVVIVGGGDSAVDWANALAPHSRSVTVVHRRARFRAHESSVAALRSGAARVLINSEISQVHGATALEAVTVRDCTSGASERIPATLLVPALGHIASLGGLTSWGVEFLGKQIPVDTDMATSRPGVYAAGDITTYPGKVALIAVGFGEAATAVNNIAVALHPDEQLFPGHSSEKLPEPAQ